MRVHPGQAKGEQKIKYSGIPTWVFEAAGVAQDGADAAHQLREKVGSLRVSLEWLEYLERVQEVQGQPAQQVRRKMGVEARRGQRQPAMLGQQPAAW